jgi:hypothetical protein
MAHANNEKKDYTNLDGFAMAQFMVVAGGHCILCFSIASDVSVNQARTS